MLASKAMLPHAMFAFCNTTLLIWLKNQDSTNISRHISNKMREGKLQCQSMTLQLSPLPVLANATAFLGFREALQI